MTNTRIIVAALPARSRATSSSNCSLAATDSRRRLKTRSAQPDASDCKTDLRRLRAAAARLLKSSQRIVTPITDAVRLLTCQIQNLRRTRDLLLPRLLSGQVELAEN